MTSDRSKDENAKQKLNSKRGKEQEERKAKLGENNRKKENKYIYY